MTNSATIAPIGAAQPAKVTSSISGSYPVGGATARPAARRASIASPVLVALARGDRDVDSVLEADEPHADAHDDAQHGEDGAGGAGLLGHDEHRGAEQRRDGVEVVAQDG